MIRASRIGVLISGVCALILTMGVARYSFTPMIPHMQATVGMTESLAGWLAGWNYLGYLTGLFMVWLMRDLKLKDYFYRYGLFIAVFSTAIMGFSDNTLIWYLSRFFGGISTALGFMLGTGLVFKWLMFHNHKEDMGIHFAGAGLGIVLSALVVSYAADAEVLKELSWRGQWFALSAFGLILAIPAMMLPRPRDEQLAEAKKVDRSKEPPKEWLALLTIAYVCAGFSNTVNVTFTSLIAEYVPLKGAGTIMWIYVGLAAAPAPFIWEKIARKIGYVSALRYAFLINIISNILMMISPTYVTVMLSSLTFGFAFMGIVSLVLSTITKRYRYNATQVMAQLTLGYCIAQILAPIVAGTIAELTGSFTVSLLVVSAILMLGFACLTMMNKEENT